MIDALKPGGWLLIEEADPGLQPLACPDEHGAAEELANKLKQAFRALMAERGVDLSFGRKLPRLLRAAGLVQVQADAFFPIGGPAVDRLERATRATDPTAARGCTTRDRTRDRTAPVKCRYGPARADNRANGVGLGAKAHLTEGNGCAEGPEGISSPRGSLDGLMGHCSGFAACKEPSNKGGERRHGEENVEQIRDRNVSERGNAAVQ